MDAHETIAALIPWYVNGTLDERDMARLSSHLESCADCAREVEATLTCVRGLHEPMDAELQDALGQRDANFARLLRDLPRSRAKARIRTVAAWTAAMLIAIGTGWLWRAVQTTETTFEAMTAPPSTTHAIVVQLMFQPDSTEQEVRAVLLDTGGTLLGSPSPKGVYRIAIARLDDPEAYAARLRRHPAVRWAEVEL